MRGREPTYCKQPLTAVGVGPVFLVTVLESPELGRDIYAMVG